MYNWDLLIIQHNRHSIYHIIIVLMCYLPLAALKLIVGLGAALSAVMSIGMLAAVIYINFQDKQIIDNIEGLSVKTLMVIFYVVSIIFLLLALCGLYGSIKAKRKNKLAPCLLTIYFVGVVIFFLVFLVLTIIFFAAPSTVFGESCVKGSTTTIIQTFHNVSQEAYGSFCQAECPCFINSTNLNSDLANWLAANNKTFNTNGTNHVSYEECVKNDKDKPNAVVLGIMERSLECGGWCSSDYPKFLRFSDINLCVAGDCYNQRPACYDQFKYFIDSKGKVMGVAGVIATVFTLLNMIFICCICFHPNNKSKSNKNFYARMMEAE